MSRSDRAEAYETNGAPIIFTQQVEDQSPEIGGEAGEGRRRGGRGFVADHSERERERDKTKFHRPIFCYCCFLLFFFSLGQQMAAPQQPAAAIDLTLAPPAAAAAAAAAAPPPPPSASPDLVVGSNGITVDLNNLPSVATLAHLQVLAEYIKAMRAQAKPASTSKPTSKRQRKQKEVSDDDDEYQEDESEEEVPKAKKAKGGKKAAGVSAPVALPENKV